MVRIRCRRRDVLQVGTDQGRIVSPSVNGLQLVAIRSSGRAHRDKTRSPTAMLLKARSSRGPAGIPRTRHDRREVASDDTGLLKRFLHLCKHAQQCHIAGRRRIEVSGDAGKKVMQNGAAVSAMLDDVEGHGQGLHDVRRPDRFRRVGRLEVFEWRRTISFDIMTRADQEILPEVERQSAEKPVNDSCRRFVPAECLPRSETVFRSPARPPSAIPGSCPVRERTDGLHQTVVVDSVEGRRQVSVQNPHPLGGLAPCHREDALNRVVTAPARAKTKRSGSNRASHSGSRAFLARACMTRSLITGIPSGRCFPLPSGCTPA